MPPGPRRPYRRGLTGRRRAGPALFDVLTQASAMADLSSFRVGDERVYVVIRPEHVVSVLAEKASIYSKHGHRASRLLGQGLVSSTGELWSRQRRLLQPQFTAVGIRPYTDRMVAAAQRRAGVWQAAADAGTEVELAEEMRLYALDTIWRAIFSEPLDMPTERILAAIDRAVDSVPTEAQFLGRAAGRAGPGEQEFARAIEELDELIYRAMSRHEADGAKSADDLLSVLRAGPGTSRKQIRDELVTALIAGHETTARGLAWTLHYLKCHPHWEREVLAELAGHTAAPDANPAQPSYLPVLTAFLSEVMRMYPPVWVYPRRTTAEERLGGWVIPAGSHVVLSPYFTQRHPEFWLAPDAFRPERFLPGSKEPQAKGAYLPFGIGERACIGKQFAMAELKILLAELLPRFELDGMPSSPVSPIFRTTLRPDLPVRMRVVRRSAR
jgi:cytochrome P450